MKLAPSILSADFANLERDIRRVEEAGAHYIHVDVMDGHFVPNITIGAPVVRSIRKVTKLPLDVHLMITHPDKYIDDFIDAGADIITVHFESEGELLRQIDQIHQGGCKASVAIRPGTPVTALIPYLTRLDMALVMTVEPGFGGQGFIPETMDKIRQVRKKIDELGIQTELEIDGGANLYNVDEILQAGADVIVAGSAIFGSADTADAVTKFLMRSI